MSPPKPGLHQLFREALPMYFLIVVLSIFYSQLERYGPYLSISMTVSVYIWTFVWTSVFLVSLRFTSKTCAVMVAANGWVRNYSMLRDLYAALGKESSCERAETGDFGGAVVCTLVAVGGSYYLATRFCGGCGRDDDDDAIDTRHEGDGGDDVEKVSGR